MFTHCHISVAETQTVYTELEYADKMQPTAVIAYISIFCRVYSIVLFPTWIIHYLQMFVNYILPRK